MVSLPIPFSDPADAAPERFDADEQLHALARHYALAAAQEGHARHGRGAVIVPWPPEGQLSVSFQPEVACLVLGEEVMRRIATCDLSAEFVMVYLFPDGGTDVFTYRIPESAGVWLPPKPN